MLLVPLFTQLEAGFGVDLAALGLAVGIPNAVGTVLQLPMGSLSDTRSRELVLGLSLGVGTLGVVLVLVAPTFWWLLAAQVIVGIGIAGHHPAHYPMIADATAESWRGRAFSLHGFAGSLGFAAPFPLATAVLWAGYGWRTVVGAVAAMGVVFTVVALWTVRTRIDESVRYPTLDESAADASLRQRITDAVYTPVTVPGMLGLAVLALLTSMAVWGVRTYTPTLLTESYGVSTQLASPLVSAMLVLSAVMILIGGVLSDRRPLAQILLGGYAALTVACMALASSSLPLLALVPVVLVLSGVIEVSRPARIALTDRLSGRNDLGRNFALMTVGIAAGGAIAPPLFGALITELGVTTVFAALSALGVACVVLTLVVVRTAGNESPESTPAASG